MAISERIRQGRYKANLSMAQLAEKAGVSATAISKYECGKDVPGSDVLLRLSKAMGVSVEFFLRPRTISGLEPLNFRKRKSFGRKNERVLMSRIQDWLERYLEIERIAYRDGVAPQFLHPATFPREVSNFEDVEQAAEDLRMQWGLGLAPIKDLTLILEAKGIKVGVIEADAKFEGLTFRFNDNLNHTAIITRAKTPGDRQRLSLAHELGHLMLMPQKLDEEAAAYRFAGAFLAPRPVVKSELPDERSSLSPGNLHSLKHRYGLSMQAWIRRALDVGIVSDDKFRSIQKLYSKRGWRTEEPWDQVEAETPERFEKLVLQAQSQGVISISKAGELFGRPISFFQRDTRKSGDVVC